MNKYVKYKVIDKDVTPIKTFLLKVQIMGIQEFPFEDFYEIVNNQFGIPDGYSLLEDSAYYLTTDRTDIVIPLTQNEVERWCVFTDPATGFQRDARPIHAFYCIKNDGCVFLSTKGKFRIYRNNNTIEAKPLAGKLPKHYVRVTKDLKVTEK